MRIQSITESNTNRQSNPFAVQNVDHASSNKNASQKSFKECLKTQIQDDGGPAKNGVAEQHDVVALMGCYMPQWVPIKPEMKIRARDYYPVSG